MKDSPLAIAFKEWAVVCQALAEGKQSVLLRKGGIAEENGEFRPDHSRFWLYPTFFHEHRTGIRPQFLPLLEAAEASRPPSGIVRLTHFIEVKEVLHFENLDDNLGMLPTHIFTADVVRQRFLYRTPGLFLLNVNVFAVPRPIDIVERPDYAGCKTWVTLDSAPSTEGAQRVLSING